MNTDTIFTELSLVIALAAGMALIMRLLRQPLIIGHILTGIIVGPSVLYLLKTPATITTFSNIGIALLLFIIGLGLNPRVIKEVGKVAAIVGLLQVGAITALGWAGSLLLGINHREAILFGLALSFSSTIIILKLLNDKKEQTRLYGKVAIGILLVQDLIAMVVLLVVTAHRGGSLSVSRLELLTAKGIGLASGLFLIGAYVLPHLRKLIAGSQEFLFLFAIGWGFGAAALFAKAGFSIEVGALLGGIALAPLTYAQEMSSRLKPLRDFFIVVFFISLGTQLNFGSVNHLLIIIILSSVAVIIIKPLVVLVLMGLLGYTKRTSFKTAVVTGQVSEFSLVFILIAYQQHLVSANLVSALTIVALITIAISTYMTLYNDQLYHLLEHQLALFERRHTHFDRESRNYYDGVLFGYNKGGHEFVKVFESIKKPYVVIDYDPDAIEILEHLKIHFIYGDATDLELLEEAGLDKTKMVVSTISDHKTNVFILDLMAKINPDCVIILHADTVEQATELYDKGASYVMLPHYIGSEKIGSFIRKNGFNKQKFKRYREKQIDYLQHHYSLDTEA